MVEGGTETTLPADFSPGDKIIKSGYGLKTRVYIVGDPVRTKMGKLRMHSEVTGNVRCAWWSPGWLPDDYRWEPQ